MPTLIAVASTCTYLSLPESGAMVRRRSSHLLVFTARAGCVDERIGIQCRQVRVRVYTS